MLRDGSSVVVGGGGVGMIHVRVVSRGSGGAGRRAIWQAAAVVGYIETCSINRFSLIRRAR